MSGAEISGDLSLQNARVSGNLFCRPRDGNRTQIYGNAWFFGLDVGDLVELSGALITGDLLMEDVEMRGGLFCRPEGNHRTTIDGHVWLNGASVLGTVDMGGAKIGGDLLAETAEVKGGVFCRPQDGRRTEIGGRLWLSAAKISSQLSISGAQIGGNAVLQHADIEGGVVARPQDGFRTEINGQLWMIGAKIDGGLDLTGTRIAGDVYLQNAQVDDFLLQGEDGQRPIIDGTLDLEAATIGRIEMDGRVSGEHPVKLPLADVTHLTVGESLPASVELEGFRFRQLTLPGSDYLGWLSASGSFQSSTYLFMEDWLRNHGNHRSANRVYLAMRRRDRRQGRKGILRRLGDFFLDATVGYGINWYRPLIVYFVPILVLSVYLFSNPRSVAQNVSEYSPTRIVSVSPATEEWGLTDAITMALRTNLPMFTLMTDSDWEPSSEVIVCCDRPIHITYAGYALIASLLSWIAVPLFVVGLSGILKKED